jgi:hypothetical protein
MTLIILHDYALKDLLDQQVLLVLQMLSVLLDLHELLVQPALIGPLVLQNLLVLQTSGVADAKHRL